MKNLKNLALVVLLGVIILLSFRKPKEIIKTDTIYKTDTVEVVTVKYDTIWKTKTETKIVKVPEYIIVDDSTKQYSDTVKFDSLDVYYSLKTTGNLKDIQIGYSLTQPMVTKVVEHTKTITNTVIRYRNGLYIGGEIGGNSEVFNFSPKVDLRINKWNYSYRYGVTDKTHNIGISYNIISFKSK